MPTAQQKHFEKLVFSSAYADEPQELPENNYDEHIAETEALRNAAKEAENITDKLASHVDDPSIPAFTFRAVLIGSVWGIFLSSCNVLFSFRTNNFFVPTAIAQLISYPMGVLMARTIPKNYQFFNPGPFTIKEHVIIYIIGIHNL